MGKKGRYGKGVTGWRTRTWGIHQGGVRGGRLHREGVSHSISAGKFCKVGEGDAGDFAKTHSGKSNSKGKKVVGHKLTKSVSLSGIKGKPGTGEKNTARGSRSCTGKGGQAKTRRRLFRFPSARHFRKKRWGGDTVCGEKL